MSSAERGEAYTYLGHVALPAAPVRPVEKAIPIAGRCFRVLIDGNTDCLHVQHSPQPVTLRAERIDLVEHSLQQRFRGSRRNAGLLQLQDLSALPADLNAHTRDL